jgi:hypothetical protein
MAHQSRREPARFVAGGASLAVAAGAALIRIAAAEVRTGHSIASIGWFRAGLSLVILGAAAFAAAAVMFFWPDHSVKPASDLLLRPPPAGRPSRDKEWADRLAMMNKGARVAIVGQIAEIERHVVSLDYCELD